MTAISGILLAAGSARRFGAPKLLQPLADGVAVASAAAIAMNEVLPNITAVVKPGDHALVGLFTELGLRVVENPLADEGMGTSLAAGIKANAGADGWLIALADMPWIQSATISAVVDRLVQGASMIAPVCSGRRGHPVGFSSRWLQPLSNLSGDLGARELITTHGDALELLTTEDAGILKDVDYPKDLWRLS